MSEAIEGPSMVAKAAKAMWGYKYATMKEEKLIRNWAQVKNSDAVFAISSIGKAGDVWKADLGKPKAEQRVLIKDAIQGGTGYAVEMAIQQNKPVYVFDQNESKWFTWNGSEFTEVNTPSLTKNFAGIGTREINEIGKQAITDVYINTLQGVENVEQKPRQVKVDLENKWTVLKNQPVYTTDGVNTMRTLNRTHEYSHFGNPFSEGGVNGTIKLSSEGISAVTAAANTYKDWLLGKKDYADYTTANGETIVLRSVEPEQREWILDEINSGKLDNATLLYDKRLAGRNEGTHAESLAEVINELRNIKPYTENKSKIKIDPSQLDLFNDNNDAINKPCK
jgi:hypothetical protein